MLFHPSRVNRRDTPILHIALCKMKEEIVGHTTTWSKDSKSTHDIQCVSPKVPSVWTRISVVDMYQSLIQCRDFFWISRKVKLHVRYHHRVTMAPEYRYKLWFRYHSSRSYNPYEKYSVTYHSHNYGRTGTPLHGIDIFDGRGSFRRIKLHYGNCLKNQDIFTIYPWPLNPPDFTLIEYLSSRPEMFPCLV